MKKEYKYKSIYEQMTETGMSEYEINKFLKDIYNENKCDNLTNLCLECKYFLDVYGVKTCGKPNNQRFLEYNVTGCFGGEKW